MLDFLWTLRGAAPLNPNVAGEVVIDRMEKLLAEAERQPRRQAPERVTFDMSRWSGARDPLLPMSLYERGRFSIEAGADGRTLSYTLSSIHAAWAGVGLASALTAIALLAGARELHLILNGVVLVAVVYGACALISAAQTTRLIRETAARS
ncbi:hypothetical protein CFHF_00585 [Caulobacter flavus]|uniref:Uncharacterized protein n=1 Tax=Caulobacter flavus TaxID=1679497 RepID=A0A2N5D5Z5_9CAUL|nr:hypothetical protein [Caulobacter flavus]AYV45975.1 hypothetical protein C1707_06760 [Caulobacter flavus]PLR21483.1 hypothetical protein CFHF_00585 [Caulobacter flavus]